MPSCANCVANCKSCKETVDAICTMGLFLDLYQTCGIFITSRLGPVEA